MSVGRLAITRPDYVAFTVQNCTAKEVIDKLIGYAFREMGFGRYRYRQGFMAEVGGFEVYADGVQDGMGVHVRISGQGCRMMEEDPFFDWVGWFKYLREGYAARFTRLDVAIDDEGYSVPFATVLEAVETGNCVRRGNSWQVIRSCKGGKFQQSLYLGSRESEAMLRVYEKGYELGGDVPWLRFEAELKSKRAEAWVNVLLEHGWDVAIGCIRHMWEFKDSTHQTVDRTRQRAAGWWVALIGSAKHVFKLGLVAEVAVRKSLTWFVKQVAPSVAMLLEANGGDLGAFAELGRLGVRRMNEKHKRFVKLASGWGAELGFGGYAVGAL